MRKVFLAAAIVVAVSFVARGQDDWHTYPSREISSLIRQERGLYQKSSRADMVVSGNPFPSKTRVTFTGEKRLAGHYTRTYIRLWVGTRNVPPENADLLAEEFKFTEKGTDYWLPVHKNVAASIASELKAGEEVIIYYFYLGGFNPRSLQQKDTSKDKSVAAEEDSMRWLFAVERVERPGTAFAQRALENAIDRNLETSGQIKGVWFDSRQVKAKAKLVFTGDVRKLSGRRKELRDLWIEKVGAPAGVAELMQTEARFLEGDKEYWILMRTRTLEQIQEIVGKGGTVYLNTILAGAIRNSSRIDWVFLAGEYSL